MTRIRYFYSFRSDAHFRRYPSQILASSENFSCSMIDDEEHSLICIDEMMAIFLMQMELCLVFTWPGFGRYTFSLLFISFIFLSILVDNFLNFLLKLLLFILFNTNCYLLFTHIFSFPSFPSIFPFSFFFLIFPSLFHFLNIS